GGDTILKLELVEELGLIRRLPPHHPSLRRCLSRRNHCSAAASTEFFNTIDGGADNAAAYRARRL
ncbi:MAG TPA: hypothetical protein VGB13_06220, partial [Candidatus Krumholzibacteria bacterium]